MPRTPVELTDLLSDPFGTLAKIRAAGGVAELPLAGAGFMRHDTVRTLLADPRLRANFVDFLHNAGITSGPFYEWMAISPLNHDGEEHLRWRQLMSRTFTPRRVEQIRPFLREAAHALVDRFAARGACEFVAEFADEFPSLGLCELIGVPKADRDTFRGWANAIGLGFSPIALATQIAEVDAALTSLLAYTAELAAARRKDPQDDLVSRIAVAAEEDGWSDFQVHGFIAGLVFAGHETTKNQLGWMIAALAERPDVWDGVHAGRFDAVTVVEEVLRHRSTVTSLGRRAAETVTADGETIAPGEQVIVSLWSADHDESAYPAPDRLAPELNAGAQHFAFGHGPHHCLGAALARAELQEALVVLTARIGCPVLGAEQLWKPPLGITGPERLPITFAAR